MFVTVEITGESDQGNDTDFIQAFDGNDDTRWFGRTRTPGTVWLQFTFSQPVYMDALEAMFGFHSASADYQIEVWTQSDGASSWHTSSSTTIPYSATEPNFVAIDFDAPLMAKSVRVVFAGYSGTCSLCASYIVDVRFLAGGRIVYDSSGKRAADCALDSDCVQFGCSFGSCVDHYCDTTTTTASQNGDGCCPPDASSATDDDCQQGGPLNRIGFEGWSRTRGGFANPGQVPRILVVDRLAAGSVGDEQSGRGSLLWALTRRYPRVVLFEVSGTIDMRAAAGDPALAYGTALYITDAYLTVAGQSAPSPGITVRGISTRLVGVHDVIIQHLRLRLGRDGLGSGGDVLHVASSSTDIIIDHNTLSWSTDELAGHISADDINERVTWSHNFFVEPLTAPSRAESFHPGYESLHNYGMITYYARDVTLTKNLFAYSRDRNPMVRPSARWMMHNNVLHNENKGGISFSPYVDNVNVLDTERTTISSYIGNVVLPFDDTQPISHYAGRVYRELVDDGYPHQIYVDDNECIVCASAADRAETFYPYRTGGSMFAVADMRFMFVSSSPFSIEEGAFTIVPASSTKALVLANSGARPVDRDAADERVAASVADGSGSRIRSVEPLPAFALSVANDHANYDWSAAPVSFTVNGASVTLNQNCTRATNEEATQCVVDAIQPQMPAGTTAEVYHGDRIMLRTLSAGSSQQLVVTNARLGDPNLLSFADNDSVTYSGWDGIGGWPVLAANVRNPTLLPDFPAAPYDDDDADGWKNLEEWLHKRARMVEKGRILPLGDSITRGAIDRDSYRRSLWLQLQSSGFEVDFCGNLLTDNLHSDFDPDHSGHSGWRADQILNGDGDPTHGNLSSWLADMTPQIVLLHIGTSDCRNDETPASTALEIDQIIETLRDDNPAVVIMLARLIPMAEGGPFAITAAQVACVEQLNVMIVDLAASMSTSLSPVIVVDQYEGFDPATDTYDHLHPNETGENKMAQKWYEALSRYFSGD